MIDRVIKMFKQVIYYFIAVVEQGSFSKAAKNFIYHNQQFLSKSQNWKMIWDFLFLIVGLIIQH